MSLFVKFSEGLETQVTESENGKRFTVTSRLRLKPTSSDDYMEYSCQARHKALTPDMPMRSTVQLSVLCKSFIIISCISIVFNKDWIWSLTACVRVWWLQNFSSLHLCMIQDAFSSETNLFWFSCVIRVLVIFLKIKKNNQQLRINIGCFFIKYWCDLTLFHSTFLERTTFSDNFYYSVTFTTSL